MSPECQRVLDQLNELLEEVRQFNVKSRAERKMMERQYGRLMKVRY